MLPKPKNKKFINQTEIEKVAKKVNKSFEEEVKYLREKRIKNGDILFTDSHNFA
ncbi:MAG: hypothetical protein UU16_C0046G0009 [Candidatus Woesebacteria bacterium GW2011_GWA2_40_7]|uniref:Uncharacterized protein n=3 Tax=Candidatus Woeseibacteriota TaxID=1752722 RepID=A0A0G0X679_9BACT|nr:MAG: hypothetical protein UT17_C0006G0008 [Candidatus Woesebacteria bacterium GW2011_GWB1_39_10]KKR72095.1 MAG: hypothetical protein UU16_C0046G0009 [Candidatus Woesebacteria bacterium GW2011_GWA2_40_7]KKR92140.1 MAG: hypothetical protein UU42_C0003G0009 [Candidatus Woesebacteria bacterium GW2011_GWA1_41_13b]